MQLKKGGGRKVGITLPSNEIEAGSKVIDRKRSEVIRIKKKNGRQTQ